MAHCHTMFVHKHLQSGYLIRTNQTPLRIEQLCNITGAPDCLATSPIEITSVWIVGSRTGEDVNINFW